MKDMKRLYLTLEHEQYRKLREHLIMNGYHFNFDTYEILDVLEDEIAYVKTILDDRKIYWEE